MKQFGEKLIRWNEAKNQLLKEGRDISFEDIVLALEQKRVVKIGEHYNLERYPKQQIFYTLINEYIYLVPFIEDKDVIFLKTIIPSRKQTKLYKQGTL